MKITIQLKLGQDKPFFPLEIEAGISLEELARQFQGECPYRFLLAKIDNRYYELTKNVEEPGMVELLDMRDNAAKLVYQRSISFVYMKAVRDKLGDVIIKIGNSLNKGLFCTIQARDGFSETEIREVTERMNEIIREDLPFARLILPGQNARIYRLGDMEEFFYGQLAPSTGYVPLFELVPYKNGLILRFPSQENPNAIPPYKDEPQMYLAFREAHDWGKLVGIKYVNDLKDAVDSGRMLEVIQLSEALHEKSIGDLADQIKEEGRRLVLIAGPSSSGKTTFAHRLIIQLKVLGLDCLYLGMDDYFKDRGQTPLLPDGTPDYEGVGALDKDLFAAQMQGLLNGETVDLPTFNFLTGRKEYGKRIVTGKPNTTIVVEGIHGLNDALTEGIARKDKFKIYISPLTQLAIDKHNRIPTTDARMLRRIVRDYQFRGRSAADTINCWPKVRDGENKNIFPYNSSADAFFNTSHIYELAVLKKYAEPLLAAVTPDREEYAESRRMLAFLHYFPVVEDDSVIVNNSILREFIGGSIFDVKD